MRIRGIAVVAVVAASVVAACGGGSSSSSGGASSGNANASGKKIALLMPETKTARWEGKDKPLFEQEVAKQCGAQVVENNANGDAPTQQSQAEAALSNGANVLVIASVNGTAAAAIATMAKQAGVPVIAYDRLIMNGPINYYVSFDSVQVGKLEATGLVSALGSKAQGANVVEINGDPADPNAGYVKQGAHSVLDGKVNIKKEYDTPMWSPDQAQTEMTQALTALNNQVDGVLSANDGMAGGAVAAMQAAGLNPIPPITGQDAELAAVQRVVTGTQAVTVYKPIAKEANAAADIACNLAAGQSVPSNVTNGVTTNNGAGSVPSVLLTPVAVTKTNIKQTVVADGFWAVSDICTAQYAQACTAAGVS